jgi:hypothetical protein
VSLEDKFILKLPCFSSGSQEIEDFLGVALQVQQHESFPNCVSRVRGPFRCAQKDYFMVKKFNINRG